MPPILILGSMCYKSCLRKLFSTPLDQRLNPKISKHVTPFPSRYMVEKNNYQTLPVLLVHGF